MRKPTLPTINAAPSRNLWPAFMICSRAREAVVSRETSSPIPPDSRPRLGGRALLVGGLLELVHGDLVLLVLGPAGLRLGTVVLEEAGVGPGQRRVVLLPAGDGASDDV